ncbi:response regulator transcription factor [Clostridium polynesiense]|uniref:response regulator transcription factor n=1 Tax=Clostridium polynesiense TaxID=1325933 RepID=UPI00058EF66C|nr:response regulator transcription factor [Clostridium polynesiense]
MQTIFVVEDDLKIKTELMTLLKRYGYKCIESKEFENIVEEVLKSDAQLVLLDINLPFFDGYHVCREIRKKSHIPIIVVTSRDSEMDELMSMNLGADDFITKPYNTQILLARISSLLKRAYNMDTIKTLTHKGVTLDLSKSTASYEGKEVELTKNELRILNLLIKNSGVILPRDEIMNDLWQSDEFVDDNTLTVNINRLRKKLEEIGVYNYLITKRGQGYLV